MTDATPTGPLKGLTVFDLTRVLAGPTCVQMLADLGADVIKIETAREPGTTRGGSRRRSCRIRRRAHTSLASIETSGRVTLDIATPEGQAIALELIAEVRHPGGELQGRRRWRSTGSAMRKSTRSFSRGWSIAASRGSGRPGPMRRGPGYDGLVQAMGGVMSLTGEPGGLPVKVGVPVADVFAGLYGCIGILAALRHREATGLGQQVDIGMLDTHVAWLANQGMNYLATGENPARLGNDHPEHRALPGVPDRGRAHRAVDRE